MKTPKKRKVKHMIPCHWCDRDASIKTCGKCKQIKKYQMMKLLKEEPKAVLYYDDINKHGRKAKKRNEQEVRHIVKLYKEFNSIRKVAKHMGRGKHYIQNVLKYAKENKLDD